LLVSLAACEDRPQSTSCFGQERLALLAPGKAKHVVEQRHAVASWRHPDGGRPRASAPGKLGVDEQLIETIRGVGYRTVEPPND